MLGLIKVLYRAYNSLLLAFRNGIRYAKYSNIDYDVRHGRNGFFLLKVAHSVEKGMSAREFNSTRGLRALNLLKDSVDRSHNESWENVVARQILEARNRSNDLNRLVDYGYTTFKARDHLLLRRRSHRSFKKQRVEDVILQSLYDLIKNAPSSCNRQSGRVHVFREKEKIDRYLEIQTGNGTFREEIYNLAIITFCYEAYQSYSEIELGIVDGSILGTYVLLGLESLGLGSVPLNWAATSKMEKRAHSLGDIPRSEKIVLMIGFGYALDYPKFAVSKRKAINQLIVKHE